MRLALALALLVACSAQPAMIAPGEWHEASLPPGVLARADLERGSIEWDKRLLRQPPRVIAAVVLHEVCHLRGHVSERTANCCAARMFASVYGDAAVPEIVEFFLAGQREEAAMAWLACGGSE